MNRRLRKRLRALAALGWLALAAGCAPRAVAQSSLSPSPVYAFSALTAPQTAPFGLQVNSDGAHLWSAPVDNYGVGMVGVAADGGANGTGTIYTIDPQGAVQALYTFSALNADGVTNPDGAHPYEALAADGIGGFYGTTRFGGAGGSGTIFHVDASGVFQPLASFSSVASATGANSTGAYPNGLVMHPDGRLYGTTSAGGAFGSGAIFAFDPATDALTVLHSLAALDPVKLSNADGARPYATLAVGAGGLLYGGTSVGGVNRCGTVFSISPSGVFTVVHTFAAYLSATFSNADGFDCSGIAADAGGSLYGTCESGGSFGSGVVFSMPSTGGFKVLYMFDPFGDQSPYGNGYNDEGAYPNRLTIGADGRLYGTTAAGGAFGCGSLFRMASDGTGAAFQSLDSTYGASLDGGVSQALDGSFYGASVLGGGNGAGCVFRFAP